MFDPVSLSVYPEQYPEPGMQDMLFWMLDQVGAFLAWLPLWVWLLILAILIVTGCAVISLAGWKWIAATRRQDVDAAREAVRMLKDFFGVFVHFFVVGLVLWFMANGIWWAGLALVGLPITVMLVMFLWWKIVRKT
jgi:hypothetical protein